MSYIATPHEFMSAIISMGHKVSLNGRFLSEEDLSGLSEEELLKSTVHGVVLKSRRRWWQFWKRK